MTVDADTDAVRKELVPLYMNGPQTSALITYATAVPLYLRTCEFVQDHSHVHMYMHS